MPCIRWANGDFLLCVILDGCNNNIDLTYQSELAGRKWHAGVAALGALHQQDNKLLAYQLQAFAGQDDSIGAGVGAIYRIHTDSALLGANVFFDYEDGDYDSHTRWSIGGEAATDSQYDTTATLTISNPTPADNPSGLDTCRARSY